MESRAETLRNNMETQLADEEIIVLHRNRKPMGKADGLAGFPRDCPPDDRIAWATADPT